MDRISINPSDTDLDCVINDPADIGSDLDQNFINLTGSGLRSIRSKSNPFTGLPITALTGK